jgi:hypothetical protein
MSDDNRPRVYLAGPMRGIPDFNFPTFFDAEADLKRAGFYVHNPAREDMEAGFLWDGATGHEDMATLWGIHQPKDLKQVLVEDISWILSWADGVVVLPGWENSKGARAEVSAALAAGIPVQTVRDAVDGALVEITEVPPMPGANVHGVPAWRDAQPGEEVRVTSATGGQKGKKLAQLGSLDPQSLLTVAEVSGFGAQKYARYNYLKGYDWSLSFDALQRHLLAFWSGQDTDPESGLPHLGHAAWHALALLSFSSRGLGTDDRFKQEGAA